MSCVCRRSGLPWLLTLLLVVSGGCDEGLEPQYPDPNQPPPQLHNLVVNLPAEPFDSAIQPDYMGAFPFYDIFQTAPEGTRQCKWAFLEFASRSDGCGGLHPSPTGIPNFEFYPAPNLGEISHVISPIDGTVLLVGPSTNDSAVTLIPHEGRTWEIEIDHLVGIRVREGDVVSVGDVIADRAGRWGFLANDSTLPRSRTELQINHVTFVDGTGEGETVYVSYCPLEARFWPTEELRQEYIQRLTWLLDGWNQFVGLPVYETSPMPDAVCLADEAYP